MLTDHCGVANGDNGGESRTFTRMELNQLKQVLPCLGFDERHYRYSLGTVSTSVSPTQGDGGRKRTCSELADPSPTKRFF